MKNAHNLAGINTIAKEKSGPTMRRVVHVGPTTAPGGMASVIQLLSANPPEGWRASTCNTFSDRGLTSKLNRWRIAKKEIKNGNFDLVHIHCAAGWSYKRKLSIAKVANAPVIFHIHSGKFDIDAKSSLSNFQVVCLSESWSKKLKPLVGDSISVQNPIKLREVSGKKREKFTLLMGRDDPVKGHDFAYSLGLDDLRVTGVDSAPEGVTSLGWVTEEMKWELLSTAGCLIVPSKFEGQPMVILEALSVGCPVVASSNIPDLPDCVISVQNDEKDAWLNAISNPITDGLMDSVKNHDIEIVKDKWREIYDSIIDSSASTE